MMGNDKQYVIGRISCGEWIYFLSGLGPTTNTMTTNVEMARRFHNQVVAQATINSNILADCKVLDYDEQRLATLGTSREKESDWIKTANKWAEDRWIGKTFGGSEFKKDLAALLNNTERDARLKAEMACSEVILDLKARLSAKEQKLSQFSLPHTVQLMKFKFKTEFATKYHSVGRTNCSGCLKDRPPHLCPVCDLGLVHAQQDIVTATWRGVCDDCWCEFKRYRSSPWEVLDASNDHPAAVLPNPSLPVNEKGHYYNPKDWTT
jgi:hypothetical protein